MSDASGKTRAQSVEILGHMPAQVPARQNHCSVRRYAFRDTGWENCLRVTRLGLKLCDFALRYFPDGYAPHVARWSIGFSYMVESLLG